MARLVQSGLQPTLESLTSESSQTASSPGHCWVSFGGNVGDVKATFDAALALLSLHCHIQLQQRSGLYCSTPMGTQAGSPFLNSICGLTTQLNPWQLLCALQSVETQLGRVREICWGPRTLDLDLLSFGTAVVDESNLVVPHPALTYRRFVLDPLVEVDAEWRHPQYAQTTRQMLERLQVRPLTVRLVGVPPEQVEVLAALVLPKFPEVHFVSAVDCTNSALPIRLSGCDQDNDQFEIDLRRSPGDRLEKLLAAFTAIFDNPVRVSDW